MNSQSSQSPIPLILVVDDDRAMRNLLKVAMEEEGYRVIAAKDGEQCLSEYKAWQPDMVLLDALMPEMDGFTCCSHLRALPEEVHKPILMITALDDQESIDQAFAVGATDYITKPIYWTVLSQRVKRLLATSQILLQLEQIQGQLARQQSWEQFLNKTSQELCHPLKLTEFLSVFLTQLLAVTAADHVILYRYNGQILAESLIADAPSLKELPWQTIALTDSYQADYEQGQVVAINDITQSELSSEAIALFTHLDVQATLIVPILRPEKVWGLLCLHYSLPHTWADWEIERFTHLSHLVAIAIYQCQLRKHLSLNP